MSIDNLEGLSEDDFIKRIEAALDRTVDAVKKLASLVDAYEKAGHDMSRLRNILAIDDLRRVADGSLLPQLVVKLGGSPVLKHVKQLPIPDQEKIARGEPLTYYARVGGEVQPLIRHAENMLDTEAEQVFGGGRINDEFAQRARMNARDARAAAPKRNGSVVVEVRGRGIDIHQPTHLSLKELEQWIVRIKASSKRKAKAA